MNCDDVRPLLDPLEDNELPAHEALAVEAHIDTCLDCRRERDALRSLRKSLRSLGRPVISPGLRASISDAIDATDAEAPSNAGWWRWLQSSLTHAAAAVVGGLIVYGVLMTPPERARPTQEILAAHVRSLADGRLTQVAAGDPHQVKPWFAGKLPYSPVVVDLADQGFPLLGARVDTLAGSAVAALVYARREHKINVFIVAVDDAGDADPVAETRKGFTIVGWQSRGFQLWAISDLSADELVRFANAAQVASG